MNDIEIARYSTLNIIFGRDPYWFLNDEKQWEESDGKDVSFFQCDESKKISKSLFWKNLSSKIYQYDNPKYDGIASLEYEKQLSKYKINFNPVLFYEFCIYCGAAEQGIVLQHIEKVPFKDQLDIIKTNGAKLTKYGWDETFYNLLINGAWNNVECWKMWNNLIHRNVFIFDTLLYVFIHEMCHLTWNHLNRMMESEYKEQWNIAADFAINQNLSFPMAIKKKLITQFSDAFYPHAQYSFLKYFTISKELEIPKKVKKLLYDEKYFIENRDDKEINELLDFNKNSYINNKNVDFYYEIFKNFMKMKVINISGMFFKHIDDEKDKDGNPTTKASIPGGEDGEEEGEGNGQFTKQMAEIEAEKIFREAYEDSEANSGGSCPGKKRGGVGRSEIPLAFAIEEKIGNLLKRIKNSDWKRELRKWFMSYMNEKDKDITMTRSNRKRPDIFPGLKREVGLDVIFIIDTSGSVGDEEYKLFKNEIKNINRECDLEKCRIIQCHTKVSKDDKKFTLKKINDIQFVETGGTRMRSALEILARENNRKPVIIFTDGEIDYFAVENFKFKILLFVTRKEHAGDIRKRGFKVICPKEMIVDI
jgi:hypothetical protein